MEYNGYILNTNGLIIEEKNISNIKDILSCCTSDAIFFNNYYRNTIEGLNASAYNLQREHFIPLNECIKSSKPAMFGFVKKELYNGENALINVYENKEIRTISISNVVLGTRKNSMPKEMKNFIKLNLPISIQRYYFRKGQIIFYSKTYKKLEQQNNVILRIFRKSKRMFKK